MNTFRNITVTLLCSFLLVGCSSTAEPSPPSVDDTREPVVDDHHAGEEHVEPHEHDAEGRPLMDGQTRGADDLPPSRSCLDAAGDDHHAGEENVEPHDH